MSDFDDYDPFEEFERSLESAAFAKPGERPRPNPRGGNVRGCKWHPEPLTVAEVRRLLDCRWETPRDLRNRALIVVLWRGMLRCNEALSLRPADVNTANGEIRVLHAKGGKARTVAIDEAAAEIVEEWLAVRVGDHESPLFCLQNGKRLTTANVRKLLPALAKAAGIVKRVHPHGLRHSGACELRKAGVDIGVISKALGHESIATTARYLDHIQPTDVITAMRSLTWG